MRGFVLVLMIVLGACFNSSTSKVAPIFSFSSADVKDMGYCPDVSSPVCIVRDWLPKGLQNQSVGTEAYWLLSRNNQVCFVTRKQYSEAIVGRTFNCLWREATRMDKAI